jgi:hypothetical protein
MRHKGSWRSPMHIYLGGNNMRKKGGNDMEKTDEVKMLRWKGEVTFEGTPEQFKSFIEVLSSHSVAINISELAGHLGRNAGYVKPIEIGAVIAERMMNRISKEAVRMPMPGIIAGGIRSPHLHVGQEVLLVSKEQFKTFLGDVARQIAENRVETESDFYDMIKPLVKQD